MSGAGRGRQGEREGDRGERRRQGKRGMNTIKFSAKGSATHLTLGHFGMYTYNNYYNIIIIQII